MPNFNRFVDTNKWIRDLSHAKIDFIRKQPTTCLYCCFNATNVFLKMIKLSVNNLNFRRIFILNLILGKLFQIAVAYVTL